MDEKIKTSIDLMVTMVIGELAEDLKIDENILFKKFIHSTTGQMLYDEKTKLWWSGPSDIAEQFKQELKETEEVEEG